MRTRRGHRDGVADAATKDFVALRVLTALVEHGEFLTSRGAARALLRCGLVCKSWKKAADHETVWARLAYRSSPALTTAPADQPALSVHAPHEDQESYEGLIVETKASYRARARHFAASIATPFVTPTAPAASARPAQDVFRHRLLAALHADEHYRPVPDRAVTEAFRKALQSKVSEEQPFTAWCARIGEAPETMLAIIRGQKLMDLAMIRKCERALDIKLPEMYLHTCTTAGPAAVHRGQWGGAPPLDLAEVSFIFEVFELDGDRRDRQRVLDRNRSNHFEARDKAVAEGKSEEYLKEYFDDEEDFLAPEEDYVTDKLRHAFAAPPHYATRFDIGRRQFRKWPARQVYSSERRPETENLLWAATVRARRAGDGEDGRSDGVVAACAQYVEEGENEGKLLRRSTIPVDVGSEDYSSEWCSSWRVVVTAVRDSDGRCCQLADVRGYRSGWNQHAFPPLGQGFREIEMECDGEARFRIAAGDDDPEPLDVGLFLGTNSGCRPPHEGQDFNPGEYGRPYEWEVEEKEDDDEDEPPEPPPLPPGPDRDAKAAFDACREHHHTGVYPNGGTCLTHVVMCPVEGSLGWQYNGDASPLGPRLAAKLAQLEWK